MSETNNKKYCRPMAKVFELRHESQILTTSNWAGLFLIEEPVNPGSSGAGAFLPED